MKKIRLLLIEDNRLLRDGIFSVLKAYKNIVIIATSGDGKNTLLKIKQLKPNIILLDLGLRSQNSKKKKNKIFIKKKKKKKKIFFFLDFGLRSQNSLHVVEIVKQDFPEAK